MYMMYCICIYIYTNVYDVLYMYIYILMYMMYCICIYIY